MPLVARAITLPASLRISTEPQPENEITMRSDIERNTSLRRAAAASVVGSTVEWYDFTLFGTAAAFIFGRLFFPQADPVAGTVAAFSANAVGLFVRPVGGLIFSWLGDRVGRRSMLVITLVLMGTATTAIGLLPTYAQVGLWAPVLLVLCRILQGLGAGAEYGGSVVIVAELAPEKRRGFYASLPMAGVALGIMLGSGVFSLVSLLPDDQLLSWGWRLPFLLSAVGVLVGIYIRRRVSESEEFTAAKEAGRTPRVPILQILRTQPRSLVVGACAVIAENGTSYVVKTFVLTYAAVYLGMSEQVVLTGILIASAVSLITVPFFGALGDRVGVSRVYLWSAVSVGLFAFPFFWLVNTESTVLVWVAVIVLYAGCNRGMSGAQGAYLSSLYAPHVRVSGVVMSKEIATPLAGGISPIVATALLRWSDSYWPVAAYMMLLAGISAAAVVLGGTKQPRLAKISPEAPAPGPAAMEEGRVRP